jgi:hypothetical protein
MLAVCFEGADVARAARCGGERQLAARGRRARVGANLLSLAHLLQLRFFDVDFKAPATARKRVIALWCRRAAATRAPRAAPASDETIGN